MSKKNNKGFTLVELLATLVLLCLIAGIGTFAIANIIKSSKEKNYNLLITNIKDAAADYYTECKSATRLPTTSSSPIKCTSDNTQTITLGNLVKYGFLTGNSKDKNNRNSINNPNDNKDISGCQISITSKNGNIVVKSITTNNNSCPTY